MKKLLLAMSLLCLILLSSCVRQFTVLPQMKSYDFTVTEKFGKLGYVPTIDTRSELDKNGQSPSSCAFSGNRGITVLGDKNYKNELLPEIDKHMKKALTESGLFKEVIDDSPTNVDYIFRSELSQYYVVLNEQKAQDTQACVGGLIGAAIASSVDVEASTDISITGVFLKDSEEIWRKSITKNVLKIDDYSNTSKNTENTMGEAIGEGCKEIVTELATFLASQ